MSTPRSEERRSSTAVRLELSDEFKQVLKRLDELNKRMEEDLKRLRERSKELLEKMQSAR